jgi:RecJ-like exonuclease
MSNATAKTVKVECYKCDGHGKIEAFSHIANGDCFMCGGLGHKMITQEAHDKAIEKNAPSTDTIKKCEWILNATEEQIANLNWSQIYKIRNFVHYPVQGYDNLRDYYFGNFEYRFQDLQDERLTANRHQW